jgi:hypothetical protein
VMSRARPEQIIQRAVFDHLRARAARGVFAFRHEHRPALGPADDTVEDFE